MNRSTTTANNFLNKLWSPSIIDINDLPNDQYFYTYTDKNKNNALMIACQYQTDPKNLKLICDRSPDEAFRQINSNGNNAIMIACENKIDPNIIKLICDRSPDEAFRQIDRNGNNALMMTCQYQEDPKIVKRICDRSPDEAFITNNNGSNALMFACIYQIDPNIIKLICDRSPDEAFLSQHGSYRMNALMWACVYQRDPNIIKLICDKSLDEVFIQINKKGQNALIMACVNQTDPKILKLICDRSPDEAFTHTSNEGKTTLDLAILLRKDEFIEIITKRMPAVHVKEVPRFNAYKLLDVQSSASSKEIRQQFINLRKKLEKGDDSRSAKRSIGVITDAYNILKNKSARKKYDEVVDKPRNKVLSKLKEVCANDIDPVTLIPFEKLSLEELRRIYIIYPNTDRLVDDYAKPTCYPENTLKDLKKHNNKNPLTREELKTSLLTRL
jgi:ankyrin repeat protein